MRQISLGNLLFVLSLFFPFSPPLGKVIAKSMALLSTGNPKLSEERDSGRVQQKCCQGELNKPASKPLEFCDVDHTPVNFQAAEPEEFVSLEDGLNFLDRVNCPHLGSISPQYSPFSDCSSDSGIITNDSMSPFTDSQDFLAGLFGSDLVNGPSTCVPEAFLLNAPCTIERVTPSENAAETLAQKSRKNAEAARQNRIKKKKYLEELEKDRSALKTENVVLKTRCCQFINKISKLQEEVHYLKNVLANDSALASLIENIPQVPNVKLTNSFRKRPNSHCNESSKRMKVQTETAGICLHVTKDVLSLEFCQDCSKRAAQS